MDEYFRLFSPKRHYLWVFWHKVAREMSKTGLLKSVERFPVPRILNKKSVLDKNECKKMRWIPESRL
jgi:hypothetical protein